MWQNGSASDLGNSKVCVLLPLPPPAGPRPPNAGGGGAYWDIRVVFDALIPDKKKARWCSRQHTIL